MVFLLTEKEKLIIIIIASCLFLLSLLITVCIVSPICLFHKWLFKSHKYKKTPKQQIVTQESKHFQMSVIPHYGSYNGNDLISKESSKHNKKIEKQSFGNYLVPTDELAEKKGQIKILLYLEKAKSESERLFMKVEEVIGLSGREHKLEPYCYVTLEVLFGSKMRRKNFKNKAAFSFQTTTCKRGLGPVFNQCFVTPELPKNIIKDGCLRIKVCDEERYANDICLGEVILPMKQIRKSESKNSVIYDLNQPKEVK